MKLITLALLASAFCMVGRTTALTNKSNEVPPSINLDDAHFRQVLKQYEKISGVQVDIIEGLCSSRITLQTNGVTVAQQKKLIEQKLAHENIGIFEISSDRAVATWLIPETDPARKYLNHCRSSKITVPLGNFSWSKVREYWNKVPELQALRDDFKKADDELRTVLMQDEEYRLAMEEFKAATGEDRKAKSKELSQAKHKVYHRLMKESEAYREAREKRDKALFTSNIETLEYIINDYERQGEEFPVDWIGRHKH